MNLSAQTPKPPALKLVPHSIQLADGRNFSLNLPEGFEISVAAQGLKRVRFMAKAPDGRIFVTDMYSRADNRRGTVYILDGFDPHAGKFAKVTPYLQHLRNPNSVAFYTDQAGAHWFYLALTDKLERFRYQPGEQAPSSQPEVLATYPDYGLNYKYGGWHLTRTLAFGAGENHGRLFVTVGSSCNACEEQEAIRATVSVMDPDGRNARIIGRNLRNAVGIRAVGSSLYATNMGADHLGDDAPEDTMFRLAEGPVADARYYGWPYCYFKDGKALDDPKFAGAAGRIACSQVPRPYAAFAAHSSPLGLEYFDAATPAAALKDSFLVALHGSSHKRLKRGYKVIRVVEGRQQDFITGFLQNGVVHGRPCDIMNLGGGAFLLTDDTGGIIYYIRHKGGIS